MTTTWPFDDPPDTASFTTTFVLAGAPVLRVYHDFDGWWQFHGSPDDPVTEDVARLVSLGCMIERDTALVELHDLPEGWITFRSSVEEPWTREKNNPFPSFSEDGYYLEDAVWLANYRSDLHPPSEELRNNLDIGDRVKLLFRFAAENAERKDGQTERMWVLVTDIDEDDSYVGTLENDPVHSDTLAHGDVVYFHALHVMEILEDDDS